MSAIVQSPFPNPDAVAAALQKWQQTQDPQAKQCILAGIASLFRLAFRFEAEAYALPLYRVIKERLLEKAEDRNSIQAFSYPPTEKCELSRANQAGCPVLYVADNPVTALRESRCEPGEIVCISKWQFSQPRNALFYLLLNEKQNHPEFWTPILKERELLLHQSGTLTEEEEKVVKKLHQLYCEVFTAEDYALSALIGHYLLYDHPEPLDILLYPSQADQGRSCNLAIATRYADQHFKLAKIYRLKTGQREDYSDTELLEVGTVSKDAVTWRKVYNGHKKIDSVLRSHSYREARGEAG